MHRHRLAALIAGTAFATLTACTPQQVSNWVKWNDRDPVAAQEFARRPEIRAELHRSAPQAVRSSGGTVWDRLAQCESGGNWAINTGNGYYGGLQFLASTWRANGGTGLPHQHSRAEQIRVAENLRAKAGFAPWPACSRKLGLR